MFAFFMGDIFVLSDNCLDLIKFGFKPPIHFSKDFYNKALPKP